MNQNIIEILLAVVPGKCQGVVLEASTNLVSDLGLSSIDMLRVLSAIEARFDVEIFGPQSPAEYQTIGALGLLVTGGE